MLTILLGIASLFTYINTPVATMREEAADDARVASQVVYSEPVKVIEENNSKAKIETSDGYQGWVAVETLYKTTQPLFADSQNPIATVNRLAVHVYHTNDTEWGPILTLPFESRLEVVDQLGDINGRWLKVKLVDGTFGYVQRGDIKLNSKPLTKSEIVEFSKNFLGLPYTWGGRSSFGYDCSGFVQMLYRQMGISIPRDSREQAKWDGFKEISVEKMKAGDLIFFANSSNIAHVGLYIGNSQFIHATAREMKPYLRISSLKDAEWKGNGTSYYKTRTARTLIR